MTYKILYLDDEADLCEIFKDQFSSDTRVIKTFTDANLAIEATQKETFDLIVLDFRLYGMTGIEVAQKMNLKTPIFLVTGDDIKESIYPFKAIILKPYDFVVLLKMIDNEISKN